MNENPVAHAVQCTYSIALHTLKDRLVMYVRYYTMSAHVCVIMHFDPILTYYSD